MRIRVDDIPSGGQRVQVGLEVPWAADAAELALEARPTALHARFVISPPGPRRAVPVTLQASASAPGSCDRCSEDLLVHVELDSTLDFLPEPTSGPDRDDPEVELAEDELDVGWYRDGHLSLPDILSEALALALPSRTVCDDEAACDARTEALLAASRADTGGHPAFAALKDLKN